MNIKRNTSNFIHFYFIIILMGVGLNTQAQNVKVQYSNMTEQDIKNKAFSDPILFEQASGGSYGLASFYSSFINAGVYGSDDFEIAEDSDITAITVSGFQTEGNLETILSGFKLYIYTDDATEIEPAGHPSIPGPELFGVTLSANDPALSVTPTSGSGETIYTFSVAVADIAQVSLQANTRYWLVVAPVLNSQNIQNEDLHWNWYFSSDTNSTDAMFIDPDDLSGEGITEWTSIIDLGAPVNEIGFTMAIEGVPSNLNIQDTPIQETDISISPNPSQKYIHLKSDTSTEIKQVSLYSLLGKVVMPPTLINSNTIDISSLSSGVYLLSIDTNRGTLIKKVVKK